MPNKRLRFFLALLVVSIALMTYQSRWGPLSPLGSMALPLNVINASYESARTEILDAHRSREDMRKAIDGLEYRLMELETKELRREELSRENQRLSELLELKGATGGFVTTARIISRGADRWSNTLVLDKGSEDSVAKDMVVINAQGLVGKVLRVQRSYSTILMVDDATFSVAVRLQRSRSNGVMTGTGLNRGVLKYVSADVDVSVGETLVTSGLDGLFPPGIPAGMINSVVTVPEAIFKEISAYPLVDTRKVEEVLIIRR